MSEKQDIVSLVIMPVLTFSPQLYFWTILIVSFLFYVTALFLYMYFTSNDVSNVQCCLFVAYGS